MNFKEDILDIKKRISDIRAKASSEIKNDLSNLNMLDDMIVVLSGHCEDIIWELIPLKLEIDKEYYGLLNRLAPDYNENNMPIHVKANKEYQLVYKKVFIIESLISETKRTQDLVNNRRYGLTNAVRARQFLVELSVGT